MTTRFTALPLYYTNFNSHAHVERDKVQHLLINGIWYFNSHAHVERDNVALKNSATNAISTHTLTWSVTSTLALYHAKVGISTHTLTWSVTGEEIKRGKL